MPCVAVSCAHHCICVCVSLSVCLCVCALCVSAQRSCKWLIESTLVSGRKMVTSPPETMVQVRSVTASELESVMVKLSFSLLTCDLRLSVKIRWAHFF